MPLAVFTAVLLAAQVLEPPSVLWREPTRVETVDFAAAARGSTIPPSPPFRFASQPSMGTSAKLEVTDALNRRWRIKSGPEARVESFLTRLVSALGYFAEITWFVPAGVVEEVPENFKSRVLDAQGRFTWVSFELLEPGSRFLTEGWSWNVSPFTGSRELNGLKLLVMLVSNWDNKDARDARRGSNLGILEIQGVRHFFVNDWGQSLGAWKTWYGNGTLWDCAAFSAQTGAFLPSTRMPLRFGYRGQHTADFARDISRDDIRWLLRYLSPVTSAQLRTGLLVSGANRQEEECFTSALLRRIELLRRAAILE